MDPSSTMTVSKQAVISSSSHVFRTTSPSVVSIPIPSEFEQTNQKVSIVSSNSPSMKTNFICSTKYAEFFGNNVILGEEECAICLEEIELHQREYLPCTHYFHSKCIQKILLNIKLNGCPICRIPAYEEEREDELSKNLALQFEKALDVDIQPSQERSPPKPNAPKLGFFSRFLRRSQELLDLSTSSNTSTNTSRKNSFNGEVNGGVSVNGNNQKRRDSISSNNDEKEKEKEKEEKEKNTCSVSREDKSGGSFV